MNLFIKSIVSVVLVAGSLSVAQAVHSRKGPGLKEVVQLSAQLTNPKARIKIFSEALRKIESKRFYSEASVRQSLPSLVRAILELRGVEKKAVAALHEKMLKLVRAYNLEHKIGKEDFASLSLGSSKI